MIKRFRYWLSNLIRPKSPPFRSPGWWTELMDGEYVNTKSDLLRPTLDLYKVELLEGAAQSEEVKSGKAPLNPTYVEWVCKRYKETAQAMELLRVKYDELRHKTEGKKDAS